ncbi:DUF485 domain-containing protein [Paeniglutamicibacter kerguelensis]|uniref:Uncharacterized membrane protein (DUF485 family) n=1 Tax=Paeniglutamicibacter kerguelensis TaxID=254788 RepID=A0ABS4XIZ0_9MICC|nr:DUF485 domain-containing protein [Paeniglutamicibacter kerguelensis]MBP2388405.1 uncharacterized membrane protein (DUF485 family) [Paeniglutamicibacter kerguelensis]
MSSQDASVVRADPSVVDLRATPEFTELRKRSRNFTFTAGAVVWVWAILLFWAVGYAPKMMAVSVIGPINLGFIFVWSQVFVALIVAVMFVRHSRANEALIAKMRQSAVKGEK